MVTHKLTLACLSLLPSSDLAATATGHSLQQAPIQVQHTTLVILHTTYQSIGIVINYFLVSPIVILFLGSYLTSLLSALVYRLHKGSHPWSFIVASTVLSVWQKTASNKGLLDELTNVFSIYVTYIVT